MEQEKVINIGKEELVEDLIEQNEKMISYAYFGLMIFIGIIYATILAIISRLKVNIFIILSIGVLMAFSVVTLHMIVAKIKNREAIRIKLREEN